MIVFVDDSCLDLGCVDIYLVCVEVAFITCVFYCLCLYWLF